MMIYTNNTGPREWANHIIEYFESKIEYKLIDQIIAAFRINGKQVELYRTSHHKTHEDFIRCTKVPLNAEICFMDDSFYPEMANDNIYYINVKPYYYDLKFEDMLERFKKSNIGKKIIENDENFDELIMEHIKLFKYMVSHLQTFFNCSTKNKTIKNKGNKKNKTLKHF
jgi:hypothetical protein